LLDFVGSLEAKLRNHTSKSEKNLFLMNVSSVQCEKTRICAKISCPPFGHSDQGIEAKMKKCWEKKDSWLRLRRKRLGKLCERSAGGTIRIISGILRTGVCTV